MRPSKIVYLVLLTLCAHVANGWMYSYRYVAERVRVAPGPSGNNRVGRK